MKKIIRKIQKIFLRKKLTDQEKLLKRFEHLGIHSESEEGKQLQIAFEKTRTRKSNRTNPELRKLKKSMEKGYIPPEEYNISDYRHKSD